MTDLEPKSTQSFGTVVGALLAELDWELLGRAYCDEGGEHFFPPEQREALVDAGLRFAAELGAQLPPGGASLYVGAGVAELVPLLFEALLLQRTVRVVTLDGPEPIELNRALAAVEAAQQLTLPRVETTPLGELDEFHCDHLWLVSVLNDPVEFPALAAALYERGTPEAADIEADLARARELADLALDHLQPPNSTGRVARLTASDDDLRLLAPAARERGWVVDVPEAARLSAIVGDAVRLCSVSFGSVADERHAR